MSCVAILERVRTGGYKPKQPPAKITERRIQTLLLICEGKSHKQIGPILGISVKTVEKHRQALNKFANVHSAIELYKWAIARGYVQPPPRDDK